MFRERIKVQGKERSPKWDKVRDEHIRLNPCCAVCGSRINVQVHHKKPFHLFPELELDPNNLVSLCEGKKPGLVRRFLLAAHMVAEDPGNHHLNIGHNGHFKDYNPNVDADIAKYKKIIEAKKAVELYGGIDI